MNFKNKAAIIQKVCICAHRSSNGNEYESLKTFDPVKHSHWKVESATLDEILVAATLARNSPRTAWKILASPKMFQDQVILFGRIAGPSNATFLKSPDRSALFRCHCLLPLYGIQ
jgi:hypothetical protein